MAPVAGGGPQPALATVRSCFSRASRGSSSGLGSHEQWDAFVQLLAKAGLIRSSDAPLLDEVKRAAAISGESPLGFGHFADLALRIDQSELSSEMADLLRDLESLSGQVFKQTSLVRLEELDFAHCLQLLQVLSSLTDANRKNVALARGGWKQNSQQARGHEGIQALFWDAVAAGPPGQADAQDQGAAAKYQSEHATRLWKARRAIRVRQVYHKDPKRPTVLARQRSGITRYLMFSLAKDTPVEVISVPATAPYDALWRVHQEVRAHQELHDSAHFVNSLGDGPDEQIYMQHIGPLVSVGELVATVQPLTEGDILFRAWAVYLITALHDISRMCTLDVTAVPTIDNVFVADNGTRIVLRGLAWGAAINAAEVAQRESALVLAFGQILVTLLAGRSPDKDHLPAVFAALSPELQYMLTCCLGNPAERPTTKQLVSHPFLKVPAGYSIEAAYALFANTPTLEGGIFGS